MRERGLKFKWTRAKLTEHRVAPVRERGLKFGLALALRSRSACRSREGAWIEMRKSGGIICEV